MNANHAIGDQPINKTIEKHPVIGEILQKYDIGCVTCGVGFCLLKDVVSIHALGAEGVLPAAISTRFLPT